MPYAIGIDVGTTNLKVALIRTAFSNVVCTYLNFFSPKTMFPISC